MNHLHHASAPLSPLSASPPSCCRSTLLHEQKQPTNVGLYRRTSGIQHPPNHIPRDHPAPCSQMAQRQNNDMKSRQGPMRRPRQRHGAVRWFSTMAQRKTRLRDLHFPYRVPLSQRSLFKTLLIFVVTLSDERAFKQFPTS